MRARGLYGRGFCAPMVVNDLGIWHLFGTQKYIMMRMIGSNVGFCFKNNGNQLVLTSLR